MNQTEYAVANCPEVIEDEAESNIIQQERAPVHDQRELQSSVSLSVRKEDHTILVANIDRTASQTKIMNDLRKELPKFAVPYRNVDQRILEAIRVKSARNLTDEEAALGVFGDARYARQIRYWQNRWELQ